MLLLQWAFAFYIGMLKGEELPEQSLKRSTKAEGIKVIGGFYDPKTWAELSYKLKTFTSKQNWIQAATGTLCASAACVNFAEWKNNLARLSHTLTHIWLTVTQLCIVLFSIW